MVHGGACREAIGGRGVGGSWRRLGRYNEFIIVELTWVDTGFLFICSVRQYVGHV